MPNDTDTYGAQRQKASRRRGRGSGVDEGEAAGCSTPEGITTTRTASAASIVGGGGVCSTPEGITTTRTRQSTRAVRYGLCAQRQKASRRRGPLRMLRVWYATTVLNARRHHDDEDEEGARRRGRGRGVLNARRHHDDEDSVSTRSASPAALCSTPEGITTTRTRCRWGRRWSRRGAQRQKASRRRGP